MNTSLREIIGAITFQLRMMKADINDENNTADRVAVRALMTFESVVAALEHIDAQQQNRRRKKKKPKTTSRGGKK